MSFVVLVGVLLPFADACATAHTVPPGSSNAQTLVFDAVFTKYNFGDQPPRGDSVGDVQAASGALRDASRNTVGTFQFTCRWTKVTPSDVTEACSGSITTADGTVRAAGTGYKNSPNPPWRLTAGTGRDADIRGSVLTSDIYGQNGSITDSVLLTTATTKRRLTVGVAPRPTANAAFIRRANQICASTQSRLVKLPSFPLSDFDPLHPDPKLLPQVGQFFSDPARRQLARDQQQQLIGLSEPPVDREDWDRVVHDRARIETIANRQISAALARDVPAFIHTVEDDSGLSRDIQIDTDVFGVQSCQSF